MILFNRVNVWKEGILIATEIYKEFKNCMGYGLRDQIQRSAVSIPSNIAEGYERQIRCISNFYIL